MPYLIIIIQIDSHSLNKAVSVMMKNITRCTVGFRGNLERPRLPTDRIILIKGHLNRNIILFWKRITFQIDV